jgi:hypothetical protein
MEENMNAVKIVELKVKVNQVEEKKFHYVDLGEERNSQRVWINSLYFEEELKNKLDEEYNETIGILKNARIEKTLKGNYVIKKGTNNIFFILVLCGYRGSSHIKVVSEYVNLIRFDYYHSENGKLGISEGVVIETSQDNVKIEWQRDGRLYGEPDKGVSVIKVDASVESVDNIDIEELKEIDNI